MATWVVVYAVKYSERWCADECSWVEHDEEVQATTERAARREFRRMAATRRRFIVGRHVSTTPRKS